jgi:hypothetical protein
MWNRQFGLRFRAGIRFVPLSRSEEEFVDEQIALVRADRPLVDPVAVITTLMESLTNSSVTSIPPAPATPFGRTGGPDDKGDDDDDDIIEDLRDIVSSI